MATRVGGPLAVKANFSVYELFVLDAEGKAIAVGYGALNPSGMLVKSFQDLTEATEGLDRLQEAALPGCMA